MKKYITPRLKTLLATAGVFALMAGIPQAQAYVVTTGGIAALDGSGLTTAVGSTVLTFNDLIAPVSGNFTYGGVAFSGGGQVVLGSSPSQYATPANDTTNYLIAGGPTGSFTGSETLAISGPSSNYFGLYWGSMDAYNTLTFMNDGITVATVTGSDVAAGGIANGNQVLIGTNNYFNIFDLPQYDTVILASTSPNFEVDNIAFGSVPEPGTLALLGAGLLGLGVIRRRRRRTA